MKVAVIGAGVSGLTAIKACLEQGLMPVCYERTGNIGGLWRYTEQVYEDQGCVSRSTVSNTSKHMMSFSDFPMSAESPTYPRHTDVYEYLKCYASHYRLEDHVHFNMEVLNIEEADDFSTTGDWYVTVRDKLTSQESTTRFGAVMVCNGHNSTPKIPHFSGLSSFHGPKIHSQAFKDPNEYAGKDVVVIGIANSACDMAVDLSRVASKVYLSTRSGAFVFSRTVAHGMPLDLHFTKRISRVLRGILPASISSSFLERLHDNNVGHFFNDFKPAHRMALEHITINDDFHNRVHCGSIVVKSDVERFTKNGIIFKDGSCEENIDAVFFGTGYQTTIPFLNHSVIDPNNSDLLLYKNTFLPDLQKQTLGIIGLIQTTGSTLPVAEMQSRWVAQVFKGQTKLPSTDSMWKYIRAEQQMKNTIFTSPKQKNIFVDWLPFMDSIAEDIGCKPNLRRMFFGDFKLWKACVFDACTPYQFRLMGPNDWSGARDTIMTQWQTTNQPFNTRVRGALTDTKDNTSSKLRHSVFICVAAISVYILFIRTGNV